MSSKVVDITKMRDEDYTRVNCPVCCGWTFDVHVNSDHDIDLTCANAECQDYSMSIFEPEVVEVGGSIYEHEDGDDVV